MGKKKKKKTNCIKSLEVVCTAASDIKQIAVAMLLWMDVGNQRAI